MKHLFLLLFPVLLLTFCSTPFITPEKLGQDVFEAFKEERVDIALDFLLYEDDYMYFFNKATIEQQDKDRLITKHCRKEYLDKMDRRFRTRFDEIIADGKAAGIVWKNTTFKYVKGPDGREYKGVQSDKIDIIFSHEDQLYRIQLDDCYLCERGWLMSDEPRWKGKWNK